MVSLTVEARPSDRLRRLLRRAHSDGAPPVDGVAARSWSLGSRDVVGRYVFGDETSANAFRRDRGAVDPLVGYLARLARLRVGAVEAVYHDPLVRPIFVVSAPRAGSTMLFAALARSTALWSIGAESHHVIEGVPSLHPRATWFESHALTEAHADPLSVRALRCAFLAHLHDSAGRRHLDLPARERPRQVRLLEKTPENALRVPFLRAAFPDARFVWLLRDPRQNISSIIEAWTHDGFVSIPALPGWDGDWHLLLPPGWRGFRGRRLADVAAFQWVSANAAIVEALAAAPSSSWLAVGYDELVAAPAAALQRVCEFLEVPLDEPRCLPVAPTTVTPPSPTKWRYNPLFDEAALRAAEAVIRRMDALRRTA